MEAEPLMTVQEVADYLRVSRQTVYNMIRENRIPHFRIGNKVRFKRSDIEALTKTHAAPAAAPTGDQDE